MPILDTFSRQLVTMVRSMPDDALLQLVVHGLATPSHATASKKATPPATAKTDAPRQPVKRPNRKQARPTATSTPAAAKPAATTPSARLSKEALTAAVEKVIRSSNGLGLAQVADAVGQPKPAVSNVIRELKERRRIHLGGDRRFARYAGDAKTAKAASQRARAGK